MSSEDDVAKRLLIAALTGALGVAGCGGGGGSSGATPAAAAPTVTITATNQGTVARAMVDGGQAFGQSPPFATPGGAEAQSIGAAPTTLRTGVLQSVVERGLVAAFGSRHSASIASIQGSVGVAAAITSTSFQIALTVGADALTVTSSAPGYLDTIVYEPGMQLAVTATDGALPRSDVTLNGSFTVSSIGGRVWVATVLPLRQLGTDANPSSGQVVVTGASGTHLRVTALNSTSVQLELDGNGDGTYERSGAFAWDSIG